MIRLKHVELFFKKKNILNWHALVPFTLVFVHSTPIIDHLQPNYMPSLTLSAKSSIIAKIA